MYTDSKITLKSFISPFECNSDESIDLLFFRLRLHRCIFDFFSFAFISVHNVVGHLSSFAKSSTEYLSANALIALGTSDFNLHEKSKLTPWLKVAWFPFFSIGHYWCLLILFVLSVIA